MDIPCAAIMKEKKKNSMITHAFSSNISLVAIMEFFYHFYIISVILFFIWIRLEMISCHNTNTHSITVHEWKKKVTQTCWMSEALWFQKITFSFLSSAMLVMVCFCREASRMIQFRKMFHSVTSNGSLFLINIVTIQYCIGQHNWTA